LAQVAQEALAEMEIAITPAVPAVVLVVTLAMAEMARLVIAAAPAAQEQVAPEVAVDRAQ
jgi:hypothetical protein